ncbi:MAG: hypothetical protein AAB408_01185 [Patescibacteria group bacterium]
MGKDIFAGYKDKFITVIRDQQGEVWFRSNKAGVEKLLGETFIFIGKREFTNYETCLNQLLSRLRADYSTVLDDETSNAVGPVLWRLANEEVHEIIGEEVEEERKRKEGVDDDFDGNGGGGTRR